MPTSKKQTFVLLDDHESVLSGTLAALKQQYPDTEILTATHAEQAFELVREVEPNLLSTDLSIPFTVGQRSQTEVGLKFIRDVMQSKPELNILVQSAYTEALVRLRPAIHAHCGGFVTVNKNLPLEDLLDGVRQALKGRHMLDRSIETLEVKKEWIDLLELAFKEGLKDKAIAAKMNVSARTVRNYWERIQECLGVYPDETTNIRMQTFKAAREAGLIELE